MSIMRAVFAALLMLGVVSMGWVWSVTFSEEPEQALYLAALPGANQAAERQQYLLVRAAISESAAARPVTVSPISTDPDGLTPADWDMADRGMEELVPIAERHDGDAASMHLGDMWHTAQYWVLWSSGEDGPSVSILEHSYRLSPWLLSIYNLDDAGHVRFCTVRRYQAVMGIVPSVALISAAHGEERKLPVIVAFQPPFGLMCLRWSAGAYRSGMPDARQSIMMAQMIARGYSPWAVVALGLLFVRLMWRRMAPTQGMRKALWVLSLLLLAVIVWFASTLIYINLATSSPIIVA